MTTHRRPLRDSQLQNGLDGEGENITNLGQIGVGTDGTPATSLHLSPGDTPTAPEKGIRFGADVTIYRDGAASLNIDATTLKVGGTAVPVGPHEYTHVQNSAATTWNVVHGLGRHPAIMIVDSAGSVVEGDVDYVDSNNVTLTFSSAFSGKAYCS